MALKVTRTIDLSPEKSVVLEAPYLIWKDVDTELVSRACRKIPGYNQDSMANSLHITCFHPPITPGIAQTTLRRDNH
jgi:hypothetical protein